MDAAQATAVAPAATQAPAMQPQSKQPVVIPALGVKKDIPRLMPERFGQAENMRHDFVVDLPIKVTLEQALDSGYWSHVADQMQPLDHIELRAEDGSWVADLIVAFCDRNYAKVVLKNITKLDEDRSAPISSIKFKVEWKGPHLKYSVIRTSDDQVLRHDMRTRIEAEQWMADHEKTVER